MSLLYAALLGVIQGLTEFLPVSSSAHLILARAFFGWDAEQFGMAFDVACHVGTLIAVLVYFRTEILEHGSRDSPRRVAGRSPARPGGVDGAPHRRSAPFRRSASACWPGT